MRVLDGLQLRATATSNNIANANTPNYRPVEVRFEDMLRSDPGGHVVPAVRIRPDVPAGKMRLDQELLTATATAARYGALTDLVNRRLQMDHLVASGARL
jgi:flagellar basal-body rod protein FlgB